MAKKKFGISPAVDKALTQTIQMAKAEHSHFFNTEILIDRITLDPENPRKHKITIQDVKSGLSLRDPDHAEKQNEYEGLCELSESIKREGLLHPIVVIEESGNFKLVAGERRFFATVIADKKVIEARVFRKKPKALDLKVIQWSENQARKDLSLYEKLMNVSAILESYRIEHGEDLTAIKLSDVISVSRQQAQFYKAILSNKVLMIFILEKKINTLEVARQLSSLSQPEIESFLQQRTEARLNLNVKKETTSSRIKTENVVKLGVLTKAFVAREIIETMLKTERLKRYTHEFDSIDWKNPGQSAKAFRMLLALMETELQELV
ncbi:MAG: ParB/RepB/Spo0J family partition protein [Coxiellaceae bacterium]|nr:ParB/RepB/Spo0J family partition protein [Coxiellaceae bacterium]